jgi:hypothetical protein
MATFDKFYTKQSVAEDCVHFLEKYVDLTQHICLEPSAGNGAFLQFLPKYEAYDILPENDLITKQDFLKFEPNFKNYITIGNPPLALVQSWQLISLTMPQNFLM